MKKVSILLFLSILFLIPACKKDNTQQTAQTSETQDENWNTTAEESAPPALKEPTMKGVMISGWYYDPVYNDDGSLKTMAANFEAIVGTQVGVYGDYDPNDENNGAEVIKDVLIDGAKKNFIHVYYDNEEYYVRDYAVAVNAAPAVVTNESAYIYTKPNLANLGKSTVPDLTIVAVFSGDIPEDEDGRFEKIRYYVPDGKTYTVNGYLMSSVLTYDATFVAGVMVHDKYNKLKAEGKTDQTVLDELAENNAFLMENYNY
ncbi:MAG: hypothetical protein J5857_07770 [Treponema sp.]|nr:hypothetical protein [Treponema sp.]